MDGLWTWKYEIDMKMNYEKYESHSFELYSFYTHMQMHNIPLTTVEMSVC